MLGKLARVTLFISTLVMIAYDSRANLKSEEETSVSTLAAVGPNCLPKKTYKTKLVTHYYVPLLKNYNYYTCDQMEGTCIYEKNKTQWLHNYGYKDQLLSVSPCKNGFGNRRDCLHPCRVLAASMTHHRYGEIVYFPKLVGMKCGNEARDGLEIVHDGYMVVLDTGAESHFNDKGRFDFFWGRCKDMANGVCNEGALPISARLTNSDACTAWDPRDPLKNELVKLEFVENVRSEAIARRDNMKASKFELDSAIGPQHRLTDQAPK